MDLKYLLFFRTLACFLASTVSHEAIIGGHKARVNEFPYQVSLIDDKYRNGCGGGILGDHFVLTAAHCVLDGDGRYYGMIVFVLAGTIDLNKIDNPAMITEIVKIYVTNEYDAKNVFKFGDIAVLKLKHSLELSKNHHLKWLELPTSRYDYYVSEKAMIAGFGWHWNKVIDNNQEIGGVNDSYLRYAEADVLSPSHLHYLKSTQFEKQICAQVKQHNDSEKRGVCMGDSGSPLVHKGTLVVIGILSVGPLGCTEKKFGVTYTRVTHYLNFIREAMHDGEHSNILRVIEIRNKSSWNAP